MLIRGDIIRTRENLSLNIEQVFRRNVVAYEDEPVIHRPYDIGIVLLVGISDFG